MSGDDYKGKLEIHKNQFNEACEIKDGENWANQHNTCFLLTHHHPNWLSNRSKEILDNKIAKKDLFSAHL